MSLEKFKSAKLNKQELKAVNGGDGFWTTAYNGLVAGATIAGHVVAAAGNAYATYVTTYPNRNP